MASPDPRWTLAGLSLPMFMASLDTSIANIGLPTLARAFDATLAQVQWIVLAYLLAITTLIVGAGRLGDLLGRRRTLLAGIALFTAASFLCGVAPTLGLLVAARAAQGLGAAVMMALSVAFVGEAVPRERTGRAMGLLGTMSAAGTALGPSLGGLLLAGPAWRTLFLVNLPVGLGALVLARHALPEDRPRAATERPPFDLAGTSLLALTLAAYALALTRGGESSGVLPGVLLAAAAVGAFLFVRVEAQASAPLVRLATLRDRALGTSLALGALVSTVMMSTLVVGPFYLSRALGLDAARVGFLLSVGPLVVALAGVPAGRLVDRVGARRMTRLGLAGLGAGSLLLSVLPAAAGVAGYVLPLVVLTSGYALFQVANNTSVMAGIGAGQRGVVSGLLSLSRNLGLVTGASLMGAVFALSAGTGRIATAHPDAVAAGMRGTFAVAAALIAGGLVLASTGPAPSRAAPYPAARTAGAERSQVT